MSRGSRPKTPLQRQAEASWNALQLPNAGSPNATPASLEIDLRYAHLRVWDRWTYERYVRLAQFLNLTPEELASIVCLPHSNLPMLKQRDGLFRGSHKDLSAALVLTVLEAHTQKAYSKDVILDVFPNLGGVGQSPKTPT